MAAAKKTTLPLPEQLAVQEHFRAGLLYLGLSHAEWARRLAEARPLTAQSHHERENERRDHYQKTYDYIRTHFKKTDPHFTCESLDQLWRWFRALIDILHEDVSSDSGSADASTDDAVTVARRRTLLAYSSYWDEQFLDLAPSFMEWHERYSIELLITRESVQRLAVFLARSLRMHGLIRKRDVSASLALISEAISVNAYDMASNFTRSWQEHLALSDLNNPDSTSYDSFVAVAAKISRDWYVKQPQNDNVLRITTHALDMARVLERCDGSVL
jgi:hypothetical protein